MLLARAGEHHVHQFVLVLGLHHDHVRHAVQVGEIEQAMVRGPISSGEACAIHAEHHRQILQRDVVDNAVVTAL